MKTLLIIVFLTYSSHFYSYAQTFYPPINQETPVNATSVANTMNTGADMVRDDNGYSKVMVFDGTTPQFAWETDNGNGIDNFYHDGIMDPDVVLTNDRVYALVCYVSPQCTIYLSVWEDNGGGVFSEIIGSFGNYSFPCYIDEGINPNIDIGFNDEFVITWEYNEDNNHEIRAIAGKYFGGVIDLSANIALVEAETSWTPDVTLRDNYVTFTYIMRNQAGNKEWVTRETTYSDVDQNTITGTLIPILFADPALHATLGRPRIAGPPYYGNYPPNDYTTVVDYYWEDGGVPFWQILVYQYDNNSPPSYYYGPLIYNYAFDSIPNFEPVVTYTGDLGIVCWTSTIVYPNTNDTTLDVIAMYFVTSGNKAEPLDWNDIAIVNYNHLQTQDKPSVAGRRWNDGYGFYFWRDADPDVDDMVHRMAYAGNYSMRLKPEKQDEKITSETDDGFNIRIESDNMMISTEYLTFKYYLLDFTGKIILSQETSGLSILSLNSLSQGIYLLKCHSANHKKIIKFVKY